MYRHATTLLPSPNTGFAAVIDLIIPAAVRTWLIFLIIIFLLGYSVPFSILYGAIGGLAGGIATGWWQMKGGAPKDPAGLPPTNKLKRPNPNDSGNPYLELPFLKTNKANRRYIERQKRARARRQRK
ncbi:hypothetical protein S7335_5430 [Synechococcus sp. PCC 7335]|nr:hypothetical protein S7335_5430 [Synechococcus sp. PCC 7335]